jgi:hypothetical protein
VAVVQREQAQTAEEHQNKQQVHSTPPLRTRTQGAVVPSRVVWAPEDGPESA